MKFTLVDRETLARDRALINGKDAWSLINFAVIIWVITFLSVSLVIGSVVVSSCRVSTRAFAFLNLI
jgi:hypothetical protein